MSTWTPPDADGLPCEVGRYTLHQSIGQGGMARVYRAELFGPAGFRKMVALKIMRPDGADSADDHETAFLVREARVGGLLQHPHIVDVYELGQHEGVPYIAMELVNGPSLSEVLRRHGPPPPAVSLCIARQVVDGLMAAHELPSTDAIQGVVHRDLKPANILLDLRGFAKIADFGLAEMASKLRSRVRGEVYGTPAYMSPEQLRGDPLDTRSDHFAFGAVLFEIFTGDRLFRAGDVYETATMILEGDAGHLREAANRLNGIVPDLGGLVWRCLQPVPELRYPSTADLADALHRLDRQPVWTAQVRRWINEPERVTMEVRVLSASGIDDTSGPLADRGLGTLAIVEHLEDGSLSTAEIVAEPASPVEESPFVGREEYVDAVRSHIASGARIVTIKGPGGMGKTRLATEVARRAAVDGEDPAVWVNLRVCSSVDDIVAETGRALGVRAQGTADPIDQLGAAFAGRDELLLILDNGELLIDPLKGLLERWCSAAPRMTTLLTSRERARLPGERVVELGPMGVDTGSALFLSRAGRVLGERADEVDPTMVRRIVERVDGMPLALELAAAQLAQLSLSELLETLDDRLIGAPGTGVLQQTIASSWALCEEWEQDAMAQLSVFQGGFRLSQAEAVLDLSEHPGAPGVIDVVSALYDQSLLRSQVEGSEPRFSMYSTVEAFAAQRLRSMGSDVEQAARNRHAACFARLGHPEWVQRLEEQPFHPDARAIAREAANLAAAQKHAGEQKATDQWVALALMRGLSAVAEGQYGAAVEALTSVPAGMGLSGPQSAVLSRWEVEARCYRGDPDQIPMSKEMVARVEQYGDERLQISARVALARSIRLAHGPKAAETLLEECMERAVSLGNAYVLGLVEYHLGTLCAVRSDHERAVRLFRRSRRRFALIGCQQRAAASQNSLAHSLHLQGLYGEALDLLESSLKIADRQGDPRMQSSTLRLLGTILAGSGEVERAAEYMRQAIEIQKPIGARVGAAASEYTLSGILIRMDRFEEARACIDSPLRVGRESKMLQLTAGCLANLGLCEAYAGDSVASEAALVESDQMVEALGNWMLAGWLDCRRSEACWALGEPVRAREYLDAAWACAHAHNVSSKSILGATIARVEGKLSKDPPAAR